MSRSDELLSRLRARECPAFGHRRKLRPGGEQGPAPIVLARGDGAHVTDADGRTYLDLCAGFGALVLGHGHPGWREAVTAQLDVMVQGMGDVYATEVKVALLERLAALHPADDAQVLLAQSGGDAVTAAIKTAVLATGRSRLIAFDGAYHGLGYAPLSACGFKPSFARPFAAQLGEHVSFVSYPGMRGADMGACLSALQAELRRGDVAAVLVEPVLGRGGCVVPRDGFLAELGALAHRHGALVVADEVWTGMGRAGAWSAMVAQSAPVDVICFGKGLGGGLSIAAAVASAQVMRGWVDHGEVVHTSTHVGAPLPCAAALATMDHLEAEGLVVRSQRLGEAWRARLTVRLAGAPVRDVRGAGLMVGVELEDAAAAQAVSAALLEAGFLVLTGGIDGATLTLTPPLTISEEALARFDEALVHALSTRASIVS